MVLAGAKGAYGEWRDKNTVISASFPKDRKHDSMLLSPSESWPMAREQIVQAESNKLQDKDRML